MKSLKEKLIGAINKPCVGCETSYEECKKSPISARIKCCPYCRHTILCSEMEEKINSIL